MQEFAQKLKSVLWFFLLCSFFSLIGNFLLVNSLMFNVLLFRFCFLVCGKSQLCFVWEKDEHTVNKKIKIKSYYCTCRLSSQSWTTTSSGISEFVSAHTSQHIWKTHMKNIKISLTLTHTHTHAKPHFHLPKHTHTHTAGMWSWEMPEQLKKKEWIMKGKQQSRRKNKTGRAIKRTEGTRRRKCLSLFVFHNWKKGIKDKKESEYEWFFFLPLGFCWVKSNTFTFDPFKHFLIPQRSEGFTFT